jgi:hypothetical protein
MERMTIEEALMTRPQPVQHLVRLERVGSGRLVEGLLARC